MRKKAVLLPTTITKSEAEDAFAEYANADAKLQGITAKMDEQITKIRSRYADEITALTQLKEDTFEVMQTYAVNNREEFGKKKSMEFAHGILGFRTGTPALKAAKGYTWKSITAILVKLHPDFVRSEVVPAKDKILADRNTPGTRAMMVECGIIVDQAETFFVEPKKELAEA